MVARHDDEARHDERRRTTHDTTSVVRATTHDDERDDARRRTTTVRTSDGARVVRGCLPYPWGVGGSSNFLRTPVRLGRTYTGVWAAEVIPIYPKP